MNGIYPNVIGPNRGLQAATTASAIPPANTVAPVVTGTLNTQDTLTTTNGTWTGTPTITFARQWQSAATSGGTYTQEAGMGIGLTAVIPYNKVGRFIRCRVTATGPGGSTQAFSNVVGPVTSTSHTVTFNGPQVAAFWSCPIISGTANILCYGAGNDGSIAGGDGGSFAELNAFAVSQNAYQIDIGTPADTGVTTLTDSNGVTVVASAAAAADGSGNIGDIVRNGGTGGAGGGGGSGSHSADGGNGGATTGGTAGSGGGVGGNIGVNGTAPGGGGGLGALGAAGRITIIFNG